MEAGNLMKASDFFGSDADGVDKFKTIALRALFDQKMEEELKQVRIEKDALAHENGALIKEVAQLKQSLAVNIDDRERVLAFKSKRIEELLVKAKEYEVINTSLLQTISSSTEPTSAGRDTRASIILLERGQPLFHAVETCREQEFKRLWEDKKAHCDQLLQQIADNDALVSEMRGFQRQKQVCLAQVAAVEALMAKTTAEKDEKIHFLERKLVFEHDRLTKEKDSEISAHQNDMDRQLTLQLDTTTQRTIEENVRVQLELRYQSAQLERLVKHIDAMTAENRQMSHEKQLVEDMNTMLSKKIKFYEHLFSKLQENDHAKSKSQQKGFDEEHASLSKVSPTRPKPPLPSLVLNSAVGVQSAFALPTASLSRSPNRVREEEDDDVSSLHLDMASLDLLGDQLNSVASEFDSHLQRREFARTELKALVQYHDASARYAAGTSLPSDPETQATKRRSKKKPMLSRAEYSPATYPARGARRHRAAPLTLDAFINEHATISPRNRAAAPAAAVAMRRSVGHSPRLPVLPSTVMVSPHPPPPRGDSSTLWRSPAETQTLDTPTVEEDYRTEQNALTARF